MRRSLALALALLALALGATACKPSSLTPFWVGERGTDDAGTGVNGLWGGETETHGRISFQVGNNKVTTMVLHHLSTGCDLAFNASAVTPPVIDEAFTLEIAFTQGRLVVHGTFDTASTCFGTYFFEALASSGTCPTNGSGRFTAAKQL